MFPLGPGQMLRLDTYLSVIHPTNIYVPDNGQATSLALSPFTLVVLRRRWHYAHFMGNEAQRELLTSKSQRCDQL